LTVSDGQGATVALNGDGTISSQGAWTHAGNFNVNNGNVSVDGNVNVDGDTDVTGTVTATEDVVAGDENISLINHLTSSVQSGDGTSGPPI
jgi:cytoskeletal protein CcmA (bactofilin family)